MGFDFRRCTRKAGPGRWDAVSSEKNSHPRLTELRIAKCCRKDGRSGFSRPASGLVDRGVILHSQDEKANPRSPAPPRFLRDEVLIRLWLNGRSPHTRRAYEADARSLLASTGKPLADLTLVDLRAWAGSLAELATASRARKIRALKSLLAFGNRIGFLPSNTGAALRSPRVRSNPAEWTLAEPDVRRLIGLEPNRRNRTMLQLAYIAGLRISEIRGLRWRDIAGSQGGAQITVVGQAGNSRIVVLPRSMWSELIELRGDATEHDPVFRSAKGGALDPSQVHRIVKRAAARAGLPPEISARHLGTAHVRHVLDRGAPAHLVQTRLARACEVPPCASGRARGR